MTASGIIRDLTAQRLEAAGMSGVEAEAKGRAFERAAAVLDDLAGTGRPAPAFFVPGRIEVLGKHTDYAGGRSLVCTTERGFCLLAARRSDRRVRAVDAASGSEVLLPLSPQPGSEPAGWRSYPATVVRRLTRNFPGMRHGADLVFASDLPPAAGMSSSSALMVAVFLALSAANALAGREEYRREIRSAEDLAGYLGTVENGQNFGTLEGDRGVGTFGGSEDHTAILCCRAGCLSRYRFQPVRHEGTFALPAGYVFVIGSSGVAAEKTGGARDRYNRSSLAARRILDLWRESSKSEDPSLGAALSRGAEFHGEISRILAGSSDPDFPAGLLVERFEHFLTESEEIVPGAGDALARGDLERFGELAARSQNAAERLLGNQIPETISLARTARELGAVAASAFGAGFGGSVWALVAAPEAPDFLSRWSARYRRNFPESATRARFFPTRPGPPALMLGM